MQTSDSGAPRTFHQIALAIPPYSTLTMEMSVVA